MRNYELDFDSDLTKENRMRYLQTMHSIIMDILIGSVVGKISEYSITDVAYSYLILCYVEIVV